MKKLTIISSILLLTGCVYGYPEERKQTVVSSNICTQIKVIDSCEYIIAATTLSSHGISIIHKQNCKYCLLRK